MIKKVDAQSHVMHAKVAEQLNIPMSVLNNIVVIRKTHTPAVCNYTQPGRKELKLLNVRKLNQC
jgi:hypothetical protein